MLTYTAQIALLYRAFFPLIILMASLLVFRPSLAIAMPPVVIWFMFPIWGVLTAPLQALSVKAVNFLMTFSSIPTYVEGNFVHIPVGVFEIAGGCSGLRYFIVSLLISILFVYLNISRVKRACLFILVALLGALIVNWIRIVILIYVGHFTEMQSSMMEDHNALGWYLYVPYLFALMAFGRRLSDPLEQAEEGDTSTVMMKKIPVTVWLVVLLLGGAFSSSSIKLVSEAQALTSWEGRNVIDGWQRASSVDSAIAPLIGKYSHLESYVHSVNSERAYYQRYYFDGSSEALKATYYLHSALPEEGWKVLNTQYKGEAVYVEARGPYGKKGIAAYWYQYQDMHSANRTAFRLSRLKGAVSFKRDTYYHWLWVPCKALCDQQKAGIQGWVRSLQR